MSILLVAPTTLLHIDDSSLCLNPEASAVGPNVRFRSSPVSLVAQNRNHRRAILRVPFHGAPHSPKQVTFVDLGSK